MQSIKSNGCLHVPWRRWISQACYYFAQSIIIMDVSGLCGRVPLDTNRIGQNGGIRSWILQL